MGSMQYILMNFMFSSIHIHEPKADKLEYFPTQTADSWGEAWAQSRWSLASQWYALSVSLSSAAYTKQSPKRGVALLLLFNDTPQWSTGPICICLHLYIFFHRALPPRPEVVVTGRWESSEGMVWLLSQFTYVVFHNDKCYWDIGNEDTWRYPCERSTWQIRGQWRKSSGSKG